MKNETELPPRLDVVTSELRLALQKLAEPTRQRVSWYNIPDHKRGRKGPLYRGEQGMYMLRKHGALGKATKALDDKQIDERSSSGEEDKRKRKKAKRGSASGSSILPSNSASNSA